MRKVTASIKVKLSKLKFNIITQLYYPVYLNKYKVNDKMILIEAQHGSSIMGNVYYILKELCGNSNYKDFSIYLSIQKQKAVEIRNLVKKADLDACRLLIRGTGKYFKILVQAKYLINDTTFYSFINKRPEQIYLNTWHGTPLKTLGRKVKDDFPGMGNVQKNFIIADYLLCPNQFTLKCFVEDYMLTSLSRTSLVMCGYPRNTVFFTNNAVKSEVQNDYSNKQLIAYMPTWRGTVHDIEDESFLEKIKSDLDYMEQQLTGSQQLFVNLHPFMRKRLSLQNYTKVKEFPQEIETYEFLNEMDCLVTDYSSVFFDFANTGKKIILYVHDYETYSSERGLYLKLSALPFPKAVTIEKLLEEINCGIEYDDKKFLSTFCRYDSVEATRLLCGRVILNELSGLEESSISSNGKQNVFIDINNFKTKCLEYTEVENLVCNIMESENYILTFLSSYVTEADMKRLYELPAGIKFISVPGSSRRDFYRFLGTLNIELEWKN